MCKKTQLHNRCKLRRTNESERFTETRQMSYFENCLGKYRWQWVCDVTKLERNLVNKELMNGLFV